MYSMCYYTRKPWNNPVILFTGYFYGSIVFYHNFYLFNIRPTNRTAYSRYNISIALFIPALDHL